MVFPTVTVQFAISKAERFNIVLANINVFKTSLAVKSAFEPCVPYSKMYSGFHGMKRQFLFPLEIKLKPHKKHSYLPKQIPAEIWPIFTIFNVFRLFFSFRNYLQSRRYKNIKYASLFFSLHSLPSPFRFQSIQIIGSLRLKSQCKHKI